MFNENAAVDYLIITANDPGILVEVRRLAERKQQKGLRTAVVTVDSITAAFEGRDIPERIRTFLQTVRRSWNIQWVLLAGDHDLVPARGVSLGPDAYSLGQPRLIISDIYYSCLDGLWDPGEDTLFGNEPGKVDYRLVCRYEEDSSYVCDIEPAVDGLDLMPDVYLGRLPFSNAQEARIMIEKTLAYQYDPPAGLGSEGMLLFGVQLHGLTRGIDDATYFWHYEMKPVFKPWRMVIDELYEDSITPDGNAINASLRITPEIVTNHLSRGYNLVWFSCHGNPLSIRISSLPAPPETDFTFWDVERLRSSSYSNVIALSCSVMEMDLEYGTSFAKTFLVNPYGGAVSFTGSSSLDYLYSKRILLLGVAQLMREFGITRIARAFALQLARPSTDRYNRFIMQYWGDPEMELWTKRIGASDSIVTSIERSENRYRVRVEPPIDSVLVCLYKEGSVFQRGFTRAGEVWFDTIDARLGPVHLTATAHNKIPSHRLIDVWAIGSSPVAWPSRAPKGGIRDGTAAVVYDARGRVVARRSSRPMRQPGPTRGLSPGVYLVQHLNPAVSSKIVVRRETAYRLPAKR